MNLALPDTDRFYSRKEFRRWYEGQPRGRYERVDGRIVAMAPERGAHLRVKGSVCRALVRAVAAAGVSCQAVPDGATVETGENDYEPDALVNCGPPMADDAVAAPNPVVVVGVLSPGAASTDTGGKLADYFRVPSITHYLIIHPTRCSVPEYDGAGSPLTRQQEDALWEQFFTAAPEQRRAFEPNSKQRKRRPAPLPPNTASTLKPP